MFRPSSGLPTWWRARTRGQPGHRDYRGQSGRKDYRGQPGHRDYRGQSGQANYRAQPGHTDYDGAGSGGGEFTT